MWHSAWFVVAQIHCASLNLWTAHGVCLLPLKSKDDTNSENWLRQCVKVATSVTQNVQHQADYLTNLGILSGIILDYEIIRDIIMAETMQESTVIQHSYKKELLKDYEKELLKPLRCILRLNLCNH